MTRIALLDACLWFGVFLLIKWAWLATGSVRSRGVAIVRLFCLAALSQVITTVAVIGLQRGPGPELVYGAIVGALAMACFFVIYMPFYYTAAASLSVQSMILLFQAGGRSSMTHLEAIFASRDLVEKRLQTMQRSGYVRLAPAGYELTRRGRWMALIFDFIKRTWRLGPGG